MYIVWKKSVVHLQEVMEFITIIVKVKEKLLNKDDE